jgi:glycosyltransferase involved in cell wall biosynthesis
MMSMSRKYRVLYLDTAPTAGGSVVSLYELLRNLDRSTFAPLVLSYTPHGYVERFQDLGLELVVWNAYGARDHRPRWVQEARQSAPVGWLRGRAVGAQFYHGLGFAVLLMRRIWPRARAIHDIIRRRRIDLVHTNIRVGHDREGIVAAKMAGVPCVSHIRDFEDLNWFDRRLAGMVGKFIYISKAVQQCHLGAGVPDMKGCVVYNAVDLSAFGSAVDVAGVRKALGLNVDDLVVGMMGRLDRWKGQDVFLRAMPLVMEAVPQARGVVIGDPVPYDQGYHDVLLALRDELGLGRSVLFHPFQQDVPAIMSALDLVVLASTSPEPFGRVLIEAMAAAKPVVATDAGATREIIEDGTHGLLVPAGDAPALAAAIVSILTHRDRALTMGSKGRERVQSQFGMEQYVHSVQAVYHELLA